MISKEKMKSLRKYLSALKDRKTSELPEKHKNHPKTFHAFLDHEIKMVKEKIEAAELELGPQK